MTEPQLLLLRLGKPLQPVISLASGPDPVFANAVQDAKGCAEEGQDLSHHVDGVAEFVSRRVEGEVCPSEKGGGC